MGLFKKENLLKLFTHVKAPKDMEIADKKLSLLSILRIRLL
jgi:hypothetical protein